MKKYPNLKEGYLDGEKLFRKYYEMGEAKSTQKLARWAISVGMASHTTPSKHNKEGLPTMGVWKAMWRWATLKENKGTAFHIAITNSSKKPTMEEWIRDMIETKIPTAWQHPTDAKKDKFLRENGWL